MKALFNKFLGVITMVSGISCSLNTAEAGVFNPEVFELKNGLKTIVVPNKRSRNAVYVMLWFPRGGADEIKGKSGLAHFLEHLMFRGTHKIGPGEYDSMINSYGGSNNAFTSYDYTAYQVKISKERLPEILSLEADRMCKRKKGQGLKIIDKVFVPEKKVVLEEMSTRIDNSPHGYFDQKIREKLFPGHPYGIPLIGHRKEVEALKHEDAMAFYNHYYGPEEAILILEGNLTRNDVEPLVKKYFDNIPANPIVKREWPNFSEIKEPFIKVEHPFAEQPRFARYYQAPCFKTASSQDIVALEVLEYILGSGEISRLYKKLVIETKLAVMVGTSFHSGGYAAGLFYIQAVPNQGISLEQVDKAISDVVTQFQKEGMTDAELMRVKNKLLADSIYARDGISNGAMAFGHTLAVGGKIDDVEKWPEYVKAVTKEDVLKVANQVFLASKSVTGYLMPQGAK
jgi:zinc protease